MGDEPQNIPQDPPKTPEIPNAVHSSNLVGNKRELLILHAGEIYRLRITKRNKLILTK